MTSNLGKILENATLDARVVMSDVYKGICSKSNYYGIIKGKRIPEKFIFDALLQRIGKSTDQFEAILSEEEYEWILFKEDIEDAIVKKHFSKAESALLCVMTTNMFQLQYILMMRAALLYYDEKYEESYDLLNRAYDVTKGIFRKTLQEYLVLLKRAMVLDKLGKDSLTHFMELYHYAKRYVTDTREQVKILPKTILCIVDKYVRMIEEIEEQSGDRDRIEVLWKKVHLFASEGISLLRNEGEILCLRELLEFQKKASEALGLDDLLEEVKLFANALDMLYEQYGYPTMDIMGCVVKKSIRTEFYLASEYFKNYRTSLGMTQEEMEENNVASDRHIRRIESGKVLPTEKTFNKLEQLTGSQKASITGYMNAVEFSMLEHNAKCAAAMSRSDYVNAEKEFMIIESFDEVNSKQYRQIMERRRMFLKIKKKEMSYAECIDNYIELVKLTQPGFKMDNIEILELNRAEVELLNALAVAYRRSDQKDKAVRVWQGILQHFYRRKVDVKHSATNVITSLHSLASMLECEGDYIEAIELCEKGISVALSCSWGNSLQYLLTQLAYTHERHIKNMNEEQFNQLKSLYSMGAAIAKIMGDKILYEYTVDYLKNNFNEFLESHEERNQK